ncbi:MAG: hypothetical protein ACXVC6_04370 [Bacteroidia bacterium]
MKTILFPGFIAVALLLQQNTQAQVWLGGYGIRTNSSSTISNNDLGGGFAISILSDAKGSGPAPKTLPADNLAKTLDSHKTEFQFQVGGSFYYSGLGHKNFYEVPLTSAAGVAKVNVSNSMWGMNLIGRMSFKNPTIFTPYVDAFTGYRGMQSGVTVTPYVQAPNTAKDTRQTITSLSGLNYGVGGGIMTNLTKRVRLDLGISYSEAFQNGHLTDLQTAYQDLSGINLNLKNAPSGFLMMNFGIQIYLYDDGKDDEDDCPCKQNSSTPTRSTSRSSGWGGSWGGSGGGRSSSVGIHVGGGGGFGGVRVK